MYNLKSILWAIVGIVIFIAVVKFFIFLLPFVIVIGLISYIKARKTFNKKNNINRNYNSYNQNREVFEESSIDNNTGEIIDVDYKEVDK